jgi:hypothetical protein
LLGFIDTLDGAFGFTGGKALRKNASPMTDVSNAAEISCG